MKNSIILSLVLVAINSSLFAQNFDAPKDGAKIYTESSTIEINQNGEALFDLWIVRSKRAKRTVFQMPKVTSVEGLEFFFKVDPADNDHYTVNVKATNAASLGTYSGTITSRSNGIQVVTGKMINIDIVPSTSVASTDGK